MCGNCFKRREVEQQHLGELMRALKRSFACNTLCWKIETKHILLKYKSKKSFNLFTIDTLASLFAPHFPSALVMSVCSRFFFFLFEWGKFLATTNREELNNCFYTSKTSLKIKPQKSFKQELHEHDSSFKPVAEQRKIKITMMEKKKQQIRNYSKRDRFLMAPLVGVEA